MTIRIQAITIDANDHAALGQWWAEALGWRVTDQDDEETAVEPPEGSAAVDVAPDLLFIKVPEPKPAKNRIHLDLRPDDHAAEVARFEAIGAVRVEIGQTGDESWVVMADPEGNEFCILRALTAEELAS